MIFWKDSVLCRRLCHIDGNAKMDYNKRGFMYGFYRALLWQKGLGDPMKLVFIGADHEVTGSCHYMEV